MKLFGIILLVSGVLGAQRRYDGYQLIKVFPRSSDDLNATLTLKRASLLDRDFHKSSVDLLVAPENVTAIHRDLQKMGLSFKVASSNIQEFIDGEGRYQGDSPDAFGWTLYYPLRNFETWLDGLVEKYPGIVTPLNAGRSYQNRPLKGVKISYRSGNPGIFIESNIHAREWISSAVSTWIINHLLTSNDPTVRNLRETIDWYVVPVLNPDGFVFSHEGDRMARKNTAPTFHPGCPGTDLNRNFPYFWNTGGTSGDPCSEMYRGDSAASEVETQTFMAFYRSIEDKITAYIDFHNSLQALMYPYGSRAAGRISNENEHISIGRKMQEALQARHGMRYLFGNLIETIYEASGSSADWVKGAAGTPLTFIYELRDRGDYNFLVPSYNIIPNAEEVWASLEVLVEEGRKFGYFPQ